MINNGAIAELKAALAASAKEAAAAKLEAREVFWEKVSQGLPNEWAAIEASGGRAGLDLGLEALLIQTQTQRRFQISQSTMASIANETESLCLSGHRLGADIGLAVVALSGAKEQNIRDAAKAALDAAGDLMEALKKFQLSIGGLNDLLPDQKGGRGQLSDQVSGGHTEFFKLFAEVTRQVWREAGLSIGGNGAVDQGFAAFLDAVHLELFGGPMRGRGAMLAKLRTWPKPRF